MKLMLGVVDIPYSKFSINGPKKVSQAKRGKKNQPIKAEEGAGPTQTTGMIADILEHKYGVMQGFVDLHMPDIAHSLENSMAGALESMMMGAPATLDPFGSAMGEIEASFKEQYLQKEEITGTGADGVPTQAAVDGVNHRMKGKRGERRPSFIDTGLYQASFKAWIE
jgi:hypothetical protein